MVLVLGDSISAGYGIEQELGWVNLLNERLLRQTTEYQVKNLSISGETTIGGLTRLPQALERYNPDIVIIELGGNDGLRGYPISKIRSNLNKLVATSLQADARVLLVGMMLPPNYGQRYTDAFYRIFSEIAATHNVPFLPFLLDGIAANTALMQPDGIHPKAEAQSMILDNIWSRLADMLGRDPAAGVPALDSSSLWMPDRLQQ
ncbi:MAG: arylesterase [Gammaproteobacteria bacterium]|nr:arylesterase [Gammaproteobacteria bacterium]